MRVLRLAFRIDLNAPRANADSLASASAWAQLDTTTVVGACPASGTATDGVPPRATGSRALGYCTLLCPRPGTLRWWCPDALLRQPAQRFVLLPPQSEAQG